MFISLINNLNNLNVNVFKLINNYVNYSKFLDIIAIFIAKYLIFILPLYLVCLFLKKGYWYKYQSLFAFWSGMVGLFLNCLISLVYFYPRPFEIGMGKALIQHPPDSSFPSDHVTLLLSVGFYLLFTKRLRLHGWWISATGFLVGLGRVFCGIHWPLDICGSFFVSLIAVFIINIIKPFVLRFNTYLILNYKEVTTYMKSGKINAS